MIVHHMDALLTGLLQTFQQLWELGQQLTPLHLLQEGQLDVLALLRPHPALPS